ncbi:MAG: TspO/MBR family protein [Pseudomonadota bacterium]
MLEYLTTPPLLSAGACIVAAGTGGAFPPDEWYEKLDKPRWNPPNWVFPLAWTVLYIAIGRSGDQAGW